MTKLDLNSQLKHSKP